MRTPVKKEQHYVVPQPPKDISEPVLSFVECVKNDRKRFALVLDGWDGIKTYTIIDNTSGDVFDVTVVTGRYYCGRGSDEYGERVSRKPEFVTDDEVFYVIKELRSFYDSLCERKAKRIRVLAERYKRDQSKRIEAERNRLKSIYCKNMEEV